MSAPIYAEHAPRAALRAFVHCVWTFSAPADDTPQPIAPDGRPELIVHTLAPYVERRADGEVAQPPVLFAGQLTQPLTLVARSAVAVVGVRFHAWAARAFLGADAATATDKRCDLVALHGEAAAALRRDVSARSDWPTRIAVVEDYVEARLMGARIDGAVRAFVAALFAGETPAAPQGVSERQFQRRFKAEVGVSPRELQSVLRFRRVFDAIEGPGPAGWVEAALAAGYFDQPQMARDFRRYLGVSARQWAMQRAGLAKALTVRASETYK